MKRTLILTGCAASIIALMAFKNKGDINRTAMAEQKTKSIDESNFDKSVKPGDDFYEYVNGNWLKKNPIPSTETRWGSFNILADSTRHRVKLIVEEASRAKDVEKGSAQQKIRDFYNTAMDTVSIDKMGAEPLTPLVKLVLSCQRKEDLVNVIADFHSWVLDVF
ncbi:MAG: peptidase M13 [Bacteroidetes bacterium OLB10]|nr:MAG: peptidase M13 [Bacteroidetes bacterium OLB10]